MTATLEMTMKDGSIVVFPAKPVVCNYCNGTGDHADGENICPWCHGDGAVLVIDREKLDFEQKAALLAVTTQVSG